MTISFHDTAQELVAHDKGIIVMDERRDLLDRQFRVLDIPETADARRQYREWIAKTPGLAHAIGGAILDDETIRLTSQQGMPFCDLLSRSGIIPGITVDLGNIDLPRHPQEVVTIGLDGLHQRLAEYAQLGARFTQCRSIFLIGDGLPTPGCITANVHALARFAAFSQEEGLAAMVTPEILMEGDHTMERCEEVTDEVLEKLFHHLAMLRVDLAGLIVRIGMILPGNSCVRRESISHLAAATVRCLRCAIPGSVAGVAFLSGGQGSQMATARLNDINLRYRAQVPWPMTFAFSRALLQPAIDNWRGQAWSIPSAQAMLAHRARCNQVARRGQYHVEMERAEGATLAASG
jgi:fructose-bisphosphate aldolase class I